MERHPRTSAPAGGGTGGVISVQVRAPMKSCPLAPIAMRLWYPSVMMMPELVTVMLDKSIIVSSPQLVACVFSPVQGDAGMGVPARYMVEPLTRATLPA